MTPNTATYVYVLCHYLPRGKDCGVACIKTELVYRLGGFVANFHGKFTTCSVLYHPMGFSLLGLTWQSKSIIATRVYVYVVGILCFGEVKPRGRTHHNGLWFQPTESPVLRIESIVVPCLCDIGIVGIKGLFLILCLSLYNYGVGREYTATLRFIEASYGRGFYSTYIFLCYELGGGGTQIVS